jgi:pyridoxal phosphate enzyme (YggS family)
MIFCNCVRIHQGAVNIITIPVPSAAVRANLLKVVKGNCTCTQPAYDNVTVESPYGMGRLRAGASGCYSCLAKSLMTCKGMREDLLSTEELRERLSGVLERIALSARRSGRRAEDVTLIAVSKTHPPELIRRAIEAGVTDLGENRVQEAEGKIIEIGHAAGVRWHLIGHLQSNKARRAVQLFDLVHSLDSAELALRLNRLRGEEGQSPLPVMIQVDLAGEETKTGAPEAELPELVERVAACEHLRLTGLMTLPPFFEEAEKVRPFFSRLRELRDRFKAAGAFGDGAGELSMGMSNDFEVAVEEGATLVRVGTAIFGQRGPRGN